MLAMLAMLAATYATLTFNHPLFHVEFAEEPLAAPSGPVDTKDHSKDALPAGWDLAYVGDSAMGDDVIKVPVGGRQTVFEGDACGPI